MPIVVCRNIDCKYISKRRTKFRNGLGEVIMCHTCKADLIDIMPIVTGDESIIDYIGYQPYECTKARDNHDK